MYRAHLIFGFFLLPGLVTADPPARDDYSFIQKVQPKHPRLFLTQERIIQLKKDMSPLRRQYLKGMRREVDSYPIPVKEAPVTDAWGRENDLGHKASSAALLYMFTGETLYKEKAIALLRFSINWYHKRYAEKKAINWYSYSRIGALCAYDWLYNHLSEDERTTIGKSLLEHIEMTQDRTFTKQIPTEGPSDPRAGYYGVPNLAWYAGLAFLNDNINDEKAEELLRKGYDGHLIMFRQRSINASCSGGSNTATTAYAAGAYYIQEYNFMYSWNAAIGGNFAERFPKLSLFPNWLLWTMIPGPDGETLEYGTGSAWHKDNRLVLPLLYLIQYRHFYQDINPEMCRVADFLLTKIKCHKQKSVFYGQFLDSSECFERHMSAGPFLFDIPDIDEKECRTVVRKLPRAEHFPVLGQTFMNSGWDEDSTYCLFTAGASTATHKQYDENNFVIYKEGFLAIDSGTRGSAGMKDDQQHDAEHMRNYYGRTIAHNCVLIKMQGEAFPESGYPIRKIPDANDGGMRKETGATVLAFRTNDRFTYIASDATKAYHPDKAASVIRQFVFVYPDYFVVYDKVTSKQKSQQKTWLLHTQNEPEIRGSTTRATQGNGILLCKTLLPIDSEVRAIGGLGKEFWCDGRNWKLSAERENDRLEKERLYGNWRIEVDSKPDAEEARFLNLIQVGHLNELRTMVDAELISSDNTDGVRFQAGDVTVEVLFDSSSVVGGRVKISLHADLADDPQENDRQGTLLHYSF